MESSKPRAEVRAPLRGSLRGRAYAASVIAILGWLVLPIASVGVRSDAAPVRESGSIEDEEEEADSGGGGDPALPAVCHTWGRVDVSTRILKKVTSLRDHAALIEQVSGRIPESSILSLPELGRTDPRFEMADGFSKRRTTGVVRSTERVDFSGPILADDDLKESSPGCGAIQFASIVSPGARGIRVHVTGMDLPRGVSIMVWSHADPRVADGPWMNRGPLDHGSAWSTVFPDDRVDMAVLFPSSRAVPDELPFAVDRVNHLVDLLDHERTPMVGTCHNDSSCFGSWATIRNSVARLDYVDAGLSYTCTGQLLDTVAGDLTPYVLTAHHCLSSVEAAESVVAYWQFQSPTCGGQIPSLLSVPSSEIAELVAVSPASDASLLLMHGALPSGLYWSGWTTDPVPSALPSTCIHHPEGTFKKLSEGVRGIVEGPFWRVHWTNGPTESGSSGAGIWRNDTGQLYGQLSGGPSACGSETYDLFGPFSTTYADIGLFLLSGPDDAFEPNGTCTSASPLSTGVHVGLVAKSVEDDWYRVSVPACAGLTVTAVHRSSFGDVDLEGYETCTESAAQVADGVEDIERIAFPKSTMERDVWVRAHLMTGTRNTYGLTIKRTGVGSATTSFRVVGVAGMPAPIPDGIASGVTRSLAVPESVLIQDLELELQIDHRWNGDLSVELTHDGVTARVIDRPGRDPGGFGFDDDGFDVILDDEGEGNVATYTSHGGLVTGRLVPSPDTLSAFSGLNANGTWTIRVTDHANQDQGSLLRWGLRITHDEAGRCARADGTGSVCTVRDSSRDLIDFAHLQVCYSGVGGSEREACCVPFDGNDDFDVDAADAALFILLMADSP